MVKTTYINNLPIIEIDNFLAGEEVDNLLNSRINEFSKAISHYPKYYRNNDRLVEDNVNLAAKLFGRLKSIESIDSKIKTAFVSLNALLVFVFVGIKMVKNLVSIRMVFITQMINKNLN